MNGREKQSPKNTPTEMTVFSDPPQNLFWKPFTSENARKLDKRREQQLGEPSEEPFPRRTHTTKNPRRQTCQSAPRPFYGWRSQIKYCWGTKHKHAFPQNRFFEHKNVLIIQCPIWCPASTVWTSGFEQHLKDRRHRRMRIIEKDSWPKAEFRRLWLLF